MSFVMSAEEVILDQAHIASEEYYKEMMDAGVFYGRNKSKTHPRSKSLIFNNRGGIEIIDLNKTIETLNNALEFLKEKVRNGARGLVVGTQPAASGIEDFAKEVGYPFVRIRWIGGTLTNFKTISKRVQYLKELREGLRSGTFDKYTKKERLDIEREIVRLEELVGGLEKMERLPDFLIIIDSVVHTAAVREASRLGIPTIVFSNTDANPEPLDYPVIGNTAAKTSIDWFLGKIMPVILEEEKAFAARASQKQEKAEGGEKDPNEREGAPQ